MTRAISGLVFVIIAVVGATQAAAQTTEFTYQGNLDFNGQPATGNYDFEFSLFSGLAGGTQIGQTIPATNVPVTNGVFAVPLNFGAAFPGADRFLEIKVRPAGGGAFTPLTPRQPVSSAPYSIKSQSSETAVNATQLGGIAANQYVLTTDPRMTDARPPTSGSSDYVQNTTTQQAGTNFNISGDGKAGGTLSATNVNANAQLNINGSRILWKNLGGTFLGVSAGNRNSLAENNTFVGELSGFRIGTGGNNTFSGYASGYGSLSGESSGENNSFFGSFAGAGNTTGNRNSYFGFRSGYDSALSDNSFFGSESGEKNVGFENAYFGSRAGRAQTDGSRNSYFGAQAGQSATGFDNAFFGWQAGQNNTGGANAMFGRSAGSSTGSGSNNSFFGFQSGSSNTSGQSNVFIGSNAGVGNTTGSNNLALGANANVSSATLTYATAIGSGAVVTNVDTIQLGRDNLDSVRIGRLGMNGTTAVCLNAVKGFAACSSSARYKTNIADFRSGIDVIQRLRPVTFNWTAGNALDLGLVAEEVAGIDPLLVTYNDKGEVEGVKYDRIGVVLINTVKEQQEKIEKLEAELRELRQLIIAVSKPEKKEENK